MAGLVNLISELHETRTKAKLQASNEKLLAFRAARSTFSCKTDAKPSSKSRDEKSSTQQSCNSDLCLEDKEKLEKSRYILEQKSILYNKLKSGDDIMDKEEMADRFLVNFDNKDTDRQHVEEKKNILAQKWGKIEDESRQKKDLHYQDVLFDEARAHGVGFMNFSRDESEREAQWGLLKKLRSETKTASAYNAEESKRKKKQMEERLRKVRNKKRSKLGYSVIETEDDPSITPPLSDEEDGELNKVTEPLVITSNAQANVMDGIAVNLRKIRDWDKGKPSINREMSQDEWTESRRQMRDKEFAPPKLYSDRIESEDYYKSKKYLQNRLKNSVYKGNDEGGQRNHHNSIHNRLKYQTDSHISKTNEYPEQDRTLSSNDTKELDKKNTTKKRPWDGSSYTWTRNNEAEFHKFWGFKTDNADDKLDSSGSNKDVGGFDKSTSVDNHIETEKLVSQNTNSRCPTSHAMSECGKAPVGTWDLPNREVGLEKSHLSENNPEIFQSNKQINSKVDICVNKNYENNRAYNTSGKPSMESDSQYDDKNIADTSYAPMNTRGWNSLDQGNSSKIDQSYNSHTVVNTDCNIPRNDSMHNSDNNPVSLMDIPSPYDNSWSSNKITVFNDYGKQNSTENSRLDQTRWENRMRHGSSEYMGGWGPNRNLDCSNNEGSDLAIVASQYDNSSESGISREQRKAPEFQESVPKNVFDKTWSSTRNSRFNPGCGQSRSEDEHSEFGSNRRGPNRSAENIDAFNEPSKENNTEYNESSQMPNVDEFNKYYDVEVGVRDSRKLNNRSWGPKMNLIVDYSHGQNINKDFDGSCGPSTNLDLKSKNENFEINSNSSQNMGSNFEQAWTPSRSAEFDQTFSRFRNASGDPDKKWSSNMNQPSDFNGPLGQRNSAEFSPKATTSTFRWKSPSQQDSMAIERAISEGLMKLRKEFDNTPV